MSTLSPDAVLTGFDSMARVSRSLVENGNGCNVLIWIGRPRLLFAHAPNYACSLSGSPATRKPTRRVLHKRVQAVQRLLFRILVKSAPRCWWGDEISDRPCQTATCEEGTERLGRQWIRISGFVYRSLFVSLRHKSPCQNQRLRPSRPPHAALRCPTF